MTFNAKNLHYEKQEPAFLRRLRGQNTSDKHNVSTVRPRKPRLDTGDDDGPTIVDEQGESMTEQEYRDLLDGKTKDEALTRKTATASRLDTEPENQPSLPHAADNANKEGKEPRAAINSGVKRRKPVKIVRDEPETKFPAAGGGRSDPELLGGKPNGKVKSKKKRIKLSFDDPAS